MNETTLDGILGELRPERSHLICSHVNPDGDAVGSVLACAALLKGIGAERIACTLPGPVPSRYKWMPGAKDIRLPDQISAKFDTVLILDVAQTNRIGAAARFITPGSRVVVIDHHLERNPCGDVNYIDPEAAATGSIIVELFDRASIPWSAEAATCAYVAIATDTGGFRFSNTTAHTHSQIAKLIECGVDVSSISPLIFDLMPHSKFRLLARVLDRTRFVCGGRVAYTEITESDLIELAANGEDIDGLINLPRSVEGVEVAILFRETKGSETKVSIRAGDALNAAAFCQHFGGGGHAAAAGAFLEAPLPEARTRILEELEEFLECSHERNLAR